MTATPSQSGTMYVLYGKEYGHLLQMLYSSEQDANDAHARCDFGPQYVTLALDYRLRALDGPPAPEPLSRRTLEWFLSALEYAFGTDPRGDENGLAMQAQVRLHLAALPPTPEPSTPATEN